MVLAGIWATRQLVPARWLSSFQLAVPSLPPLSPSTRRTDISKLECAAQAGRDARQLPTEHTPNTFRRQRRPRETGSDTVRSAQTSLRNCIRGGTVYKQTEEHVEE
jgi:hypothetical protein